MIVYHPNSDKVCPCNLKINHSQNKPQSDEMKNKGSLKKKKLILEPVLQFIVFFFILVFLQYTREVISDFLYHLISSLCTS